MKIRKNFLLIFIVVLVLTLVLSANVYSEEKYGGDITMGIDAAPPTLDWQFTTANATRHVARNVQESLVEYTEAHELAPMLAKNWEVSEDGLTWTFYLRENVYFHNGDKMSSEDVVASIERWREVSPRRRDVEEIIDVELVDEFTIKIHLEDRIGVLPQIMAMPAGFLAIMPAEIAEVPGGEITSDKLIGTGPYELIEYADDEYAVLKKFDNYHQHAEGTNDYTRNKPAFLDEIRIEFIPESGTRLAAFEAGELDIVEPILPMEFDRLDQDENLYLKTYPMWRLSLWLNTRSYPFENKNLRRAAAKAMNVEEIMWSVGEREELTEITSSPASEDDIWYTNIAEEYYRDYDPEGAKEILEEEGYEDEEIILLSTRAYDWAYNMAVPFHEQLQDAGFNVRLDVVDWPTLVDRRDDPDEFDIFTTAGEPLQDPIRVGHNYMGDYPGWGTSPRIQELVRDLGRFDEFDIRFEIWENLQLELWEEAFVFHPGFVYGVRGYRSHIGGASDYFIPSLWNKYIEN